MLYVIRSCWERMHSVVSRQATYTDDSVILDGAERCTNPLRMGKLGP